jgi:hypothetical protein
LPLAAVAQSVHRLTEQDVVKLLQGQVSPHRVGQRAREQGIDFQVTPQVDSELRRAGATDELIDTLLDLEAKTGQVAVHTAPGAEVYLDDRYTGRASDEGRLLIADVKPGEHTVRISLTGKRAARQAVTVMAGEEAKLEAPLEDARQDAFGSIRVHTSPGAQVGLDGSSRGTADAFGQLVLQGLFDGPHQLSVFAPGKAEFRQNVSVLGGQESRIDATLAPSPGAPVELPKPPSSVPNDLTGTTWEVTLVCWNYGTECYTGPRSQKDLPEKHRQEEHTSLAFGPNGECTMPALSIPCQWVKVGKVVNITQGASKNKITWGLTINGNTMSGSYDGTEYHALYVRIDQRLATLKWRE